MNTEKTLQINCGKLDETAKLAQALANNIRGGEVIEFASDLGGGKTTFTRFLVETLGSQDEVSSPSFTLENIYRCPKFVVHHFDFYRLEEAGVVGQELGEVLEGGQDLVIIEWSGLVKNLLPRRRLQIKIVAPGLESREFTFNYPEELAYLLEGIE